MSCPQISLDCGAIISINDQSLVSSQATCYPYGSTLGINFNQQLQGFAIPIVDWVDYDLTVAGNIGTNYVLPFKICIQGVLDIIGPDLNDITVINAVYDPITDTTIFTINLPSYEMSSWESIICMSCCYTMHLLVQNTDTGEILLEEAASNCSDAIIDLVTAYIESFEVDLNTLGAVKVTIEWTDCLGYRTCSTELNVCSISDNITSTCHSHVIEYKLQAVDPTDITYRLVIKKLNTDSTETTLIEEVYTSQSGFEYTFVSPGDGVYYWEIYTVIEDADVLQSRQVIIDTCDIRACWATLMNAEYCLPCQSPCPANDVECNDAVKQATIARRNALNVMTSDFWLLFNLTETLNNQWTTKDPIYIEDYRNDLWKVNNVIDHMTSYIENCAPCSQV